MTMDKFLDTLTTWVVIITLVITPTQIAKAKETTNILNNGSFDNQTEGWELDGNVTYDGNDYGELNQSVRFSGAEGGSISQDIDLKILVESEEKIIDKAHGSILSIGCNNEATGAWCSNKGTIDNLDTVKTTITFSDGTQTETLNYNFTSDYNDGVITSTFNTELEKEFNINNTTVSVNVFGDDAGDWEGKFGSIIDDLSLTLTLSDLVVAQPIQVPDIVKPEPPVAIVVPKVIKPEIKVEETVQIGSLDAKSIANTISAGIIDIKPPQENILVVDIPVLDMQMDIAEVQPIEEIAKPVLEPEPETLEQIRSEEVPPEIEETTMEEDLKLEVKQKEETKGESNEVQQKETSSKEEKESIQKEKNVLDKPVSDVEVKVVDVPTIISFDKEYFENTYKDTIDLTTTEIDFYDKQDGFNNQDYAQVNTDFFNISSSSNGEWGVANSRPVITIEQFRR
jgi:hypothetical protein